MSQKVPQPTHSRGLAAVLSDHLVGAGEQARRHGDAKRLCSRKIDDEFEFRRLLGWDFRGLAALQDLDHEIDAALERAGRIGTIRNQAADLWDRARKGSSRQPLL